MDIVSFKQLPILGIMRGISDEQVEWLVETVIASGLKTIEITMNTPGAHQLISKAVGLAQGELTIGAGTVLSKDQLSRARDAGATFIVLPVCVPEVVDTCVGLKIPVFCGALTPQEIYAAWSRGASMVKVFPSQFFGPEYFRQIKAPLEKIELLACGGVTPENLGEYFGAGASAVSFGSSVFRREWLAAGAFNQIGERIKAYVDKYQTLRNV